MYKSIGNLYDMLFIAFDSNNNQPQMLMSYLLLFVAFNINGKVVLCAGYISHIWYCKSVDSHTNDERRTGEVLFSN